MRRLTLGRWPEGKVLRRLWASRYQPDCLSVVGFGVRSCRLSSRRRLEVLHWLQWTGSGLIGRLRLGSRSVPWSSRLVCSRFSASVSAKACGRLSCGSLAESAGCCGLDYERLAGMRCDSLTRICSLPADHLSELAGISMAATAGRQSDEVGRTSGRTAQRRRCWVDEQEPGVLLKAARAAYRMPVHC